MSQKTTSDSPLVDAVQESVTTLQGLVPLAEPFARAVVIMAVSLKAGGKVLACGNGGSAADAAHFTTELLCRYIGDRPALSAIALTNDGSFLTAAANDYGYDYVFARQVEGLGKEGDVLVGISTSGNSESVNAALRTARERGLKTVSLLGRDGGAARGLADVDLIVPGTATARIQEAHKVIIHAFCQAVENELFNN